MIRGISSRITTFGNGLFAIDENNGKTFHYTADKDLTTNYLLCVTEDRSGEIWVGTELGGISKISLTNYPFDIFYPSPGGNADRDNAVRLIYEDEDGRYLVWDAGWKPACMRFYIASDL